MATMVDGLYQDYLFYFGECRYQSALEKKLLDYNWRTLEQQICSGAREHSITPEKFLEELFQQPNADAFMVLLHG